MHRDGSLECTEGGGCPEADGRADWTVHHRSFTTHRPGVADSCWCVSGDLTARIEQQMRDGEVAP